MIFYLVHFIEIIYVVQHGVLKWAFGLMGLAFLAGAQLCLTLAVDEILGASVLQILKSKAIFLDSILMKNLVKWHDKRIKFKISVD